MGWWPFSRSKAIQKDHGDNLHLKGTRHWLEDLQTICERNHEQPDDAKQLLLEMQDEWKRVFDSGEISDDLLNGLERRLEQLISAKGDEWMELLDNMEFWKPGWGVPVEDDDSEN